MSDPYSTLGLSCPSGGKFYICTGNATEYIGCCTSNPCTTTQKGTCPTSDLRNSSFASDAYTAIGPQDCGNSNANWYTCSSSNPPFLGCCTENPCDSGCPTKDLAPARLSANVTLRAAFLEVSEGTSMVSGVPTAASASASSSSSSSSGAKIGGIVGGVVGGILIIIGIALFLWYRNHNKKKAAENQPKDISPVAFMGNAKVGSPESMQMMHAASMTPPSHNGSPGFTPPHVYPGSSPIIGGYPQQYSAAEQGMATPPPRDMYNNQYFQSISSMGTNHGQMTDYGRHSAGYSSNGQPSPPFIFINQMVPVQELDSTVVETPPIIITSPQEMPTDANQKQSSL